jgi:hypothetical protein
MMNRYTIATPALLQGTRCYVDASILPDHPNTHLRMAGLGVFILNSQDHPVRSIYIKARLLACTSVLMAEATSLALAVSIIDRLNINGCSFLSDCEQLVHFINLADHSNPPDWRIKPFTQIYHNYSSTISSRVFKINRNHNIIADALACQALSSQASTLETLCSYQHGVNECSVTQALQSVDLTDVTILVVKKRRTATSCSQPPAGASCSPPSSPWRAHSAHSRCSRCTASQ